MVTFSHGFATRSLSTYPASAFNGYEWPAIFVATEVNSSRILRQTALSSWSGRKLSLKGNCKVVWIPCDWIQMFLAAWQARNSTDTLCFCHKGVLTPKLNQWLWGLKSIWLLLAARAAPEHGLPLVVSGTGCTAASLWGGKLVGVLPQSSVGLVKPTVKIPYTKQILLCCYLYKKPDSDLAKWEGLQTKLGNIMLD